MSMSEHKCSSSFGCGVWFVGVWYSFGMMIIASDLMEMSVLIEASVFIELSAMSAISA